MPFQSAPMAPIDTAFGAVATLVAGDGSAAHRHARRLAADPVPLRDLADAAHLLCMLHGRKPGTFELARAGGEGGLGDAWLEALAERFGAERTYLVTLVAAAGPLPSTPGQAQSEAAVIGQRHALDMLGQSARRGCALGAALALALDWPAIRTVLDAAADRLGIAPPPLPIAPLDETLAVATAIADGSAADRASRFGAQQLIAQHRALWDLLEARVGARPR